MTPDKRIKVMIVEDSRVTRELLEHLIGSDPRLQVVGSYERAETALCNLARVAPDVVSMDIQLPGMSGLEAIRAIMETRPTPVVVVSRSTCSYTSAASIEALRAGALAVAEKPSVGPQAWACASVEQLCSQLALMSGVKVIRQRFNHRRESSRTTRMRLAASQQGAANGGYVHGVGIVASTGGPNALLNVLAELETTFPAPIYVVQHITPSFLEGFVTWLDGECKLPVALAVNGEAARAGHVYVAPANVELRVGRDRVFLDRGRSHAPHLPSGDALFRSMAESLGPHALGVVLTGMGDDGAAGLFALKKVDAYTIAEDESSAVVNGMPEAARRLGAVHESLPLNKIAAALVQLVTSIGE